MIDGPVKFRMGSPLTEPDRVASNETPRHVVIPRRFAIAAREVTVEQYQRFVKKNPQFAVNSVYLDRFSPDPAGPMIAVSWYGVRANGSALPRRRA